MSRSKCPSYVGTCGILLQETKNAFKIITKDDKLKSKLTTHLHVIVCALTSGERYGFVLWRGSLCCGYSAMDKYHIQYSVIVASHMNGMGILVGKYELNPCRRPFWVWLKIFFWPFKYTIFHAWSVFYLFMKNAKLNETSTTTNICFLAWTPQSVMTPLSETMSIPVPIIWDLPFCKQGTRDFRTIWKLFLWSWIFFRP